MKGRILVVDDEENIGRSLKLILDHAGHEAFVCRSAAEFRAVVAEARVANKLGDRVTRHGRVQEQQDQDPDKGHPVPGSRGRDRRVHVCRILPGRQESNQLIPPPILLRE